MEESLPPSFHDLEELVRNKAKVEDVLSSPLAQPAFNMGNITLISFLKKNIKTMFRLAISDSSSLGPVTAYKLLTTVGNELCQDVINHNLLLTFFPQVFEKNEGEEIDEFVAGRYSVTASVILAADVNLATETVQLYNKMINFVYILPVYYFYQSIFNFPDRYKTIRSDLMKLELHKLISDKIKQTDTSLINPNDSFDKTAQKLIAWYNLLRSGMESENFYKQYVSDPTLEALCYEKEVPPHVLDARWNAIASFCKKASPFNCMMFLYKAAEIVMSQPKTMSVYITSALDVVSELCPTSPNVLDERFLHEILRLLIDFHDCTFWQLSVIKFIETISNLEGIDTQVAIALLPTLLAEARIRENGLLWITAYKIIGIFHKASAKSRPLQNMLPQLGYFTEFINQDWIEHERLLEKNYGGDQPKSILSTITNLFKRTDN